MRVISYNPSKDKMVVKFRPAKGKPTIDLGHFKIWGDEDGTIRIMEITSFTEEREEFEKKRNTVKLGGIWKDLKITEEDVREARETILQKLEERW